MLKKRTISLFLLTSILLVSCFALMSCQGNEKVTVKANVKFIGLNDDVFCNLSDVEVTAEEPHAYDAIREACLTLSLTLEDDGKGFITKIGSYGGNIEATTEQDETEEGEVTEETEATEAQATYFWQLFLNGTESGVGAAETPIKDGDLVEMRYVEFVAQ